MNRRKKQISCENCQGKTHFSMSREVFAKKLAIGLKRHWTEKSGF